MRLCKNKHEIEDENAKRCGECGSEAAEEMLKCCGCSTEILKAKVGTPGNKFCTGCGETLEPTPELNEALEELSAFAKARAAIETDLVTLPDPDAPASVDARVKEILKAATATVKDENGADVSVIQSEPLFEEILKGQSAISADVRSLFKHTVTALDERTRRAETANGLLIKSVLAMGREMGSLREQLAAAGNAPRGTKSLDGRVVGVAARSGPAPAARRDDGGLRGEALFMKCAAVTDAERRLSLTETSMLEQHTNMNHGLAEIAAQRPALAARVAELVGETIPVTTH